MDYKLIEAWLPELTAVPAHVMDLKCSLSKHKHHRIIPSDQAAVPQFSHL